MKESEEKFRKEIEDIRTAHAGAISEKEGEIKAAVAEGGKTRPQRGERERSAFARHQPPTQF